MKATLRLCTLAALVTGVGCGGSLTSGQQDVVNGASPCANTKKTDGTAGAQCRYGNTVPQDNGVPVGYPVLDPCGSGLSCCGLPDLPGFCVAGTRTAAPLPCPAACAN